MPELRQVMSNPATSNLSMLSQLIITRGELHCLMSLTANREQLLRSMLIFAPWITKYERPGLCSPEVELNVIFQCVTVAAMKLKGLACRLERQFTLKEKGH